MNCVGRLAVEVRTAGSEKWLQLAVAGSEAQHHETDDDDELDRGQHVLHFGRAAHAEAIESGEGGDQRRGRQLARPEPQAEGARARSPQAIVVACRHGEDVAQVVREGQGGRRDGRGETGEERNPAGHETPFRPDRRA